MQTKSKRPVGVIVGARDGPILGLGVVGGLVGASVGVAVVGALVGAAVVGASVGDPKLGSLEVISQV